MKSISLRMMNSFLRKRISGFLLFSFTFSLAIVVGGCNPFAPEYDENGLIGENFMGDRNNIDGLFQYFENSYELRDTSLYSRLFANDFIFTYFDFDQNAEIQWDRNQELSLSYNLFKGVQQISLDWNFYVQLDSTEFEAEVVRNFNLNIVQNESNVYIGSGRAKLKLRKESPIHPWKIYYWMDDSDF